MTKPTFKDYVEAGALIPRPVSASWLVRTKAGHQFSTHTSEETAQSWADLIGGTIEWFVPVQSDYGKSIGDNYDH